MEQQFYQLPSQNAAGINVTFVVINPQFSGTVASEVTNTIEWIVTVGS
jgi:hypothetical protein